MLVAAATTAKQIGRHRVLSVARNSMQFGSNSSYSLRTYILPLLLTLYSKSSLALVPHSFTTSNNSKSCNSQRVMSTSTAISASGSSAGSTTTSALSPLLQAIEEKIDNTWLQQLSPETADNLKKSRSYEKLPESDDNRRKRPVFNGHYVVVTPTGLKQPRMILLNENFLKDTLQLPIPSSEQEESQLTAFLSGNLVMGDTWATPYALSIMGTRYTNNCPYGTGNGYGDGRAISIAQVADYELQLKGAGTTPFHRGADGRAVLRSSIREFLASEAMHYMNVPTTRALSLVVSEKDTVNRPWYNVNDNASIFGGSGANLKLPSLDDPRLAQYSIEQRKAIIRQFRSTQKLDPNIMVSEKAAITCRVAPSFMRIGHIDLFARRAVAASMRSEKSSKALYDISTNEWKELQEIIWHACYREYRETAYEPFKASNDLASAATVLLNAAAENIAIMVAHWIRVGFAQGNFNADNCLVSGRTMDYGPFGFMEEYNPVFAKWTGSGQHFGFLNQPAAGFANYNILVNSVVPVIVADTATSMQEQDEVEKQFLERAATIFQSKVDETFRSKMGFLPDQDVADGLWEKLEPLLRQHRVDWTLFWRQLSYVARDFPLASTDYDAMIRTLEAGADSAVSPFYEQLDGEARQEFTEWITEWRQALAATETGQDAALRMLRTNPKFVLREWMLVDAYTAAENRKEAELFDLYQLIQHPYDEGTDEQVRKYYRRASEEALTTGGTAFMS